MFVHNTKYKLAMVGYLVRAYSVISDERGS